MTDTPSRLQASHENRAGFERLCFRIGAWTMLVLILILLCAVAWPLPAASAPDYGAAVIAKAEKAWPILLLIYGYLTSAPGVTMIRGHMDARLDSKP